MGMEHRSLPPLATDAATAHAPIVAAAAVTQAATRTARLAQCLRRDTPTLGDGLAALVSVFAAEDATAAMQLQGSFHPHVAAIMGDPR